MAELHPQSHRHFVWQPLAQVSQNIKSCYFSHTIAAVNVSRPILANLLLWLSKSTDLTTHISGTLPNCDITIGSLCYLHLKLETLWNSPYTITLHLDAMYLLKSTLCLLLETTLSDSHTLDRRVASFTCQFCTTTLTILAALWWLKFAVARFCFLTLK
jgi:hypothetical protein